MNKYEDTIMTCCQTIIRLNFDEQVTRAHVRLLTTLVTALYDSTCSIDRYMSPLIYVFDKSDSIYMQRQLYS
jgi:hypothetical protein